ncbi:hypothetical protein CAI21_16610 [Alkalilimnicola ehrlichii]|uniref:Uncharacterized protein n=1 Tax=Alkalilimnicola ehrlichii TaxID=351052 RepID=A0A3E0WL33_9GAMM|nr:hypothetical protein [Alkalilimnicola ehrlichii]RFA26585.1 hypothetical protein CAI21_16610 [Alkalilimnicola ehrlichii]RFA32913.1 hypothetical protein CAL65_18385 [Alkalilimnicola ehrlichii]
MRETDLNRVVAERSAALIAPIQLPLGPGGRFVGGLLMQSLETDLLVRVFVEYHDELIYFM